VILVNIHRSDVGRCGICHHTWHGTLVKRDRLTSSEPNRHWRHDVVTDPGIWRYVTKHTILKVYDPAEVRCEGRTLYNRTNEKYGGGGG
jgi:hypothetical protein